MTDSEEVEKVLQSLASESGNSESTDGDPDRDKVEELLRQLEQEKEHEVGGEDADQANDKPKPASRSITKKPNGSAKVGDKPAAPKKSPTRDDIPKPWKKKGAIRKKPTEDEDYFGVAIKEPPPFLEDQHDKLPTLPTGDNDEVLLISQAPPSSSIREHTPTALPPIQAASQDIPNGVHMHSPPPSPPAPSSPLASRSPSPPNEHRPITSATPHAASPTPYPTSPTSDSASPTSSAHPTASPTPHSTTPILQASPTPQSNSLPPTITLTSSTPPPSQRTPHEPTPKRDAQPHTDSHSPKRHKPVEDTLMDESIKSDERVFSKQDFESLRNEVLRQMSEETAILAQEFRELKIRYDEEVRGKTKLKSVLGEYEKTIAKLIDEAGMSGHHEGLAERVTELENDNKRKTEEYEAIALAHSELKSRHEATKTDNEKLKSNEQVQKEAISKLQNELHGSETRFHALKTHAETKLDSASEQLVKIRDERAKEMAQLQTRMQKAEARTGTLEKENKELLAICDDLMRQLEQKNSN